MKRFTVFLVIYYLIMPQSVYAQDSLGARVMESLQLIAKAPQGAKLIQAAKKRYKINHDEEFLSYIYECEDLGEDVHAVTNAPRPLDMQFLGITANSFALWFQQGGESETAPSAYWEDKRTYGMYRFPVGFPRICMKKGLEFDMFVLALAHELVHFTYKDFRAEYFLNPFAMSREEFIKMRLFVAGGEMAAFQLQFQLSRYLRTQDSRFAKMRFMGEVHLDERGRVKNKTDFYRHLILDLGYFDSESKMYELFVYRQMVMDVMRIKNLIHQIAPTYQQLAAESSDPAARSRYCQLYRASQKSIDEAVALWSQTDLRSFPDAEAVWSDMDVELVNAVSSQACHEVRNKTRQVL